MNRNVSLLALCQAMMTTGASLVVASSALVGQQLAPSPALATLPLSMQHLGTMVVLLPVAHLMQRIGRRPVFMAAALVGAGGMTMAMAGIASHRFWVFALAGLLIGIHSAVGQSYRFAAAESVPVADRSRAISLTLAGGILAAFLGPNLARLTRDALPTPFQASFLALVGTTTLAAILASFLRLPPVADAGPSAPPRPRSHIVRQPRFLIAVAAAAVAYAVMNLLMVATPLTMHACGHGFGPTASVIQWHMVAMFVPSFFTGHLIKRVGIYPMIVAGCLMNLGCVAINTAGTSVWHFHLALVLLGLGWNFLYVGATTLLTDCYRPQERAFAQGVNDTLVFLLVASSSLSSAGLLGALGWRTLNLVTVPLLAAVVLGAGVALRHRGRAADAEAA